MMAQEPPEPPRSLPPAPPPASLLRKDVPHVPLTPVMDFLSRRMEQLEKDLELERQRAGAAQSLLAQQEALRTQVEQQLKGMSESLRREKAEKENEETKQHARGRIDALEARLGEMHQSWVTLLKDAMTQRESSSANLAVTQDVLAKEQAGLKQELLALHGAIDAMSQQMSQWRADTKPLADAAPAMRAFEGQVSQMLAHFAAELRDRVSAWERRQSLELEKQEERLQGFAREKAGLMRELEERDHQIRQESLKEKLHRESQLGEQFNGLARLLDDLKAQAAKNHESLEHLTSRVMATPQAKDRVIEALEGEKDQLARALKERAEALKAQLEQRREVERTLGESLLQAQKEVEQLRGELQQSAVRFQERDFEKARLADELASALRVAQEREERRKALEAERDEISKILLLEADRSREVQETWSVRVAELQQQLAAAHNAKSREETALSELRAQMATLSDHLARALQERDAAKSQDGGKERADLLRRLEEKEQMIAMLNATFRKFLK
jgi:hypothetical protein